MVDAIWGSLVSRQCNMRRMTRIITTGILLIMWLKLHRQLPSERARDKAAWGKCSGIHHDNNGDGDIDDHNPGFHEMLHHDTRLPAVASHHRAQQRSRLPRRFLSFCIDLISCWCLNSFAKQFCANKLQRRCPHGFSYVCPSRSDGTCLPRMIRWKRLIITTNGQIE